MAANLVYVDERGVRQLQNAAAKMKATGQSKELTQVANDSGNIDIIGGDCCGTTCEQESKKCYENCWL